jgi:hypothetical protein
MSDVGFLGIFESGDGVGKVEVAVRVVHKQHIVESSSCLPLVSKVGLKSMGMVRAGYPQRLCRLCNCLKYLMQMCCEEVMPAA